MIYLLQSNRAKKRKIYRYIFVIGSIVIVLVGISLISNSLFPNLAHTAGKPIWKVQSSLRGSLDGASSIFTSKLEVVQENFELKRTINELSNIKEQNQRLTEEIVKLQAELGRPRHSLSVMAKVLSRPGISVYDTLVLDVGEDEAIAKGDLVVAGSDVLIGEIQEVYNKSSLVTLYSSHGQTVNVTFEGEETFDIEARGNGGGNMAVQVPRGIDVSVGDELLFPGLDTKVVARVESVQAGEQDSFHEVLFRIPINIFSIETVRIVRR